MGVSREQLSGKRIRNLVSKVRESAPAPLCAAGNAAVGVIAQARTMTTAVAKNLTNRSGNIPPADLFWKIPQGVRMGGENRILAYLRRVDVSHKVSIRNAPNRAGSIDNVAFESSRVNQARGARDMSRVEMAGAHAKNALDGLKVGLRSAPQPAVRSGLIAGALELPVAGAVNLIRYRRGSVSGRTAAINTAKDVVTTSLAGGVAGAGIVVVAALGVPVTGPAMVVVSGLGISACAISSTRRIRMAVVEAGI